MEAGRGPGRCRRAHLGTARRARQDDRPGGRQTAQGGTARGRPRAFTFRSPPRRPSASTARSSRSTLPVTSADRGRTRACPSAPWPASRPSTSRSTSRPQGRAGARRRQSDRAQAGHADAASMCCSSAEIIDATGWPEGGIPSCRRRRRAAKPLATDDRDQAPHVHRLGPEVGWRLKARAGRKRVIARARRQRRRDRPRRRRRRLCGRGVVWGGFSYAGQKCIRVQRVFVHASRSTASSGDLVDVPRAASIGRPARRGDRRRPDDRRGHARSASSLDRGGAASGREGAHRRHAQGRLWSPTVLSGSTIACRSLRGGLRPPDRPRAVADFDDAIARRERQVRPAGRPVHERHAGRRGCFDRIDVGALIVNDVPTFRIDHMPYGGVKSPGSAVRGCAMRSRR